MDFKTGTEGNPVIPNYFLMPALFIVISLTLDLCHYMSGSLIWWAFNKIQENRKTCEDKEFNAPTYINWATTIFFIAKIVCIIIAYWYLINFFIFALYDTGNHRYMWEAK